MLLTDLRELKSTLDIDPANTNEDKNLNFYIEWASAWIGEILNRPGFDYKSRTEFYPGSGTQKLLLRYRPVYRTPTIQAFVDNNAYYGAATDAFNANTSVLTYGTDFALQLDQPDGVTSRSGILIRMNKFWDKPQVRQTGFLSSFVGEGFGNVKVIYFGGYTVDTLPAVFRMATNMIVAKMRTIFPLGVELSSEGYEERSVSYLVEAKHSIITPTIKSLIGSYRNHKF